MNDIAKIDWISLFVERYQNGKKKTLFVYELWECVQIRGTGNNPNSLNLFVTGDREWSKAGTLKKQGDKWVFQPSRVSYAPETLEAFIAQYLG